MTGSPPLPTLDPAPRGAFVWLPDQGEVPTKRLRVAVGDARRGLLSGAWTVMVDRYGRFQIGGAGGFGLTTLGVRRAGLTFGQAQADGETLIGCGIAPPLRERLLAAPGALPWHALSLSFPFEFLRRTPRPPGDPARRPLVMLPETGRGLMYRIAFLLVEGASGRVDYEDPSDLYLGRVSDGRRSLLLIGRVVESDLAMLSARLAKLSPNAPLKLHSRAGTPPETERGLLLLDASAGHLDLIELHNLYRSPPATGVSPSPGPGQLGFGF